MSWSGLPEKIERFIVPEPNSGCWLWIHTLRSGYGAYWDKEKRHYGQTHRLAYELLVARIPAGLQLDHLCRVRCCCNPTHLEPVTIKENILRGEGVAAINYRKTHCPSGYAYAEFGRFAPEGDRRCRECERKSARIFNSKLRERDRVAYNAGRLAYYHANKTRLLIKRKAARDKGKKQ